MANFSPLRIILAAAAGGLVLLGFFAAAGAFSERAKPPERPASGFAVTAPSPAPAPNQAPAGGSALPSPEALAALGIMNPLSIEREHDRIEVRHRDVQGRIVETYLDAKTGVVLKQEVDSRERGDKQERGDD